MRFNRKVEIEIYGRKRTLKADRVLESQNITIWNIAKPTIWGKFVYTSNMQRIREEFTNEFGLRITVLSEVDI